jgi:hypothetical protein
LESVEDAAGVVVDVFVSLDDDEEDPGDDFVLPLSPDGFLG